MENLKLEVRFCNVDRLFYIYNENKYSGEMEEIHAQKTKPTNEEIKEALKSDNWKECFEDMKNGKIVRVSERIFWHMLGSVPPINQTEKSFYNGEAYSGRLHYYFEKKNGFCFGQLKELK